MRSGDSNRPASLGLLSNCGLLPSRPAGSIIACGAGVVTARLMENGGSNNKDISAVCGDLDQTMVELAARRILEHGWRATAESVDAQVTGIFLISYFWRESGRD